MLLVACGDDSTVNPSNQVNNNRNTVAPQLFFTETTTPASIKAEAIHGLEIPSLLTGTADAFIAHTLPDGKLNYCVGYNTRLKANCWTAFKWYNGFSSGNSAWNRNRWRQGETFNGYGGTGDPFQPDPLLPEALRTNLGDYSGSGYQRGHLLGSADRLNSKEANGQTFYLSNIHPQLGGFNGDGIWWNLENFLRSSYDTSNFRDTLYVVKGGTISDGNYKMVGRLACPKYFYMAILSFAKKYAKTNGGYSAIAFWMEHKANIDGVSSKYVISIDELERRTSIDFFCNLPDDIENAVERSYYLSDWKLK
ncbi:MAG: DNA/RNA non-specific endonuclease [Bacteroidaceae bacterium]|nr:DNA/RNA non-specific endonuclease [Bacteroidaceae bacterium]